MSGHTAGALAAGIAVALALLVPALRGVSLAGRGLGHPDGAALRDAGWRHGIGRWEALRLAAAASALLVCVTVGLPVLVVAVAGVAPSVWVRLRADAARERAARAVGRIVASAEGSLRSGMPLPEALRRAAGSSDEPIAAAPVLDALRSFDLGASLDAALDAAATASRDAPLRLALGTLALGIGERLPHERLADLLAEVGDRLAFEEQLAAEIRARAAGARHQQHLLAALVPALALYLSFTMPSLAATLGSDLGRFVLVPAAAALEVAGIALGRRIVRDAVG